MIEAPKFHVETVTDATLAGAEYRSHFAVIRLARRAGHGWAEQKFIAYRAIGAEQRDMGLDYVDPTREQIANPTSIYDVPTSDDVFGFLG